MKHEISGEGRKLGLQVVYGEEEDEGNLGNSPSFKKKMKKGGKTLYQGLNLYPLPVNKVH